MHLRAWIRQGKTLEECLNRLESLEDAFAEQRLEVLDVLERVSYRLEERTRKRRGNGNGQVDLLAEARQRYPTGY